jgi:predicted transcriptional regulator of viral defense system
VYTEDDYMQRYSKALGEKEARFLSSLASQDKTIFTSEEARRISGRTPSAVDQLISNLLRKRWLIRLNRGTYLIVPLSAGEESEYSENWYVVAKHLIIPAPYYLSHYSALDIHEMTVQPVLTVYISTPTRRIQKEIAGATYRFVHSRPEDLWGAEDVWVTPTQQVKVSDLERTILDCLDRPDLSGGIMEIARGLWINRESVDYEKLAGDAAKLGRKSVAKRLGFLLDLYGLGTDAVRARLQDLVTASYTPLDPSLPSAGRYVAKWRIKANVEPDEIRQAATT